MYGFPLGIRILILNDCLTGPLVGFIQRAVSGTRAHPLGGGRRQQRTDALYDAALRLLAKKDYETISVAAIAREAGTSVGAFYGRFRDKNSFLLAAISSAFRTLATEANHDLAPDRWREKSKADTVLGLVRHIVQQLGRHPAAGVTRAALKLATIESPALDPLLEYRATVTDCAVRLLTPRLSHKSNSAAVRIAVQFVFAAVIDALMQKAGPLRLGSSQMIDALSEFVSFSIRWQFTASAKDRGEPPQRSGSLHRPSKQSTSKPKSDKTLLSPEMREATRTPGMSRRHARWTKAANAASRTPKPDPKSAKAPETRVSGRGRKFEFL